jgi:MFS family permease
MAVTLTRRPLLVSGLVVAGGLPWLLVGLPAGALVDRVDRRRLVFAVDMARAVVLAVIAITVATHVIGLAGLYAAAFVVGAGETVVAAAMRAAVPAIVPADDVPAANGYVFAAETAGERFAGPALGGVAFAWWRALPFVGDAVSYVVSGLLLLRAIPGRPATARQPRQSSLFRDIRVGLRWFARQRTLGVLAAVVTSFALCQAAVLAVLVLYGTHTLHLRASGYGLLLAVAALGDVGASVAAGRLHMRLGPYRTILLAGALAGASYILLGATSAVVIAATALVLEAAGTSIGNVATLSVRHRIIPSERFGLINNLFRMFVMGAVPLGALAGGILADVTGVRTTFVVAGAVQLVCLAALAWPLRSLAPRRQAEPAPVR